MDFVYIWYDDKYSSKVLFGIQINTSLFWLSSESHLYKLSMFVLVYIIILNLYK